MDENIKITDYVMVAAERYKELVAAEVKLEQIERMYRGDTETFSYNKILSIILGDTKSEESEESDAE